jgi:glucokinase
MGQAIGVDIGGTKIAFALVRDDGQVTATHQLATGAADGVGAVIDRIAQGVEVLLARAGGPVDGIGMGCPGLVNPTDGIVHAAVNLHWVDVLLCAELRRRLSVDVPLVLHKDTNAGALGELYFGAARGCRDFVYIAIGTGLGAGAVTGGQLILGANYFATDIGHISLDPEGRLCSCGLHGCIERYLSGLGLAAGVREHRGRYPQSSLAQVEEPATSAILDAARDGDPLAGLVIQEAGEWLGKMLAYCGVMLNPALVVIGGGLGHAMLDLIQARAEHEFHRRVLKPIYEHVRIVPSQIASSAVGAASLVWHAEAVNRRV